MQKKNETRKHTEQKGGGLIEKGILAKTGLTELRGKQDQRTRRSKGWGERNGLRGSRE